MEENKQKNFINLLGKNSFSNYVRELFTIPPHSYLDLKEEIGKGVFEIRKSQGMDYKEVLGYFIHYLPLELFKSIPKDKLFSGELIDKLEKYRERIFYDLAAWESVVDGSYGGHSIMLISNNIGLDSAFYQQEFIPLLNELVQKLEIDPMPNVGVGTPDSFFNLSPDDAEEALKRYLNKYDDGLVIDLFEDSYRVNKFIAQRPMSQGVLQFSKNPVESLIYKNSGFAHDVILEFENLLNSNPKEQELESFLKRYYQEVFGPEYDRIETQLWLKFPELDISGKNRRLDIFIRNSIDRDWEIVELKKAITLSKTYRDVPVLQNEI